MFNVCPGCGAWGVEREIEDIGPGFRSEVVCADCGARIPFIRRPAYVVTGASGTGKSSICLELMRRDSAFIVLESDILYGTMDVSDDAGLDTYWNAWLRVVKNLNQGNRPVILCGTVVPDRLEPQPERRYLREIHYLALATEAGEHSRRLRERPAWRGSSEPGFIADHIAFNEWLVTHADAGVPGWSLLDTTDLGVNEAASRILDWATRLESIAERDLAR